jgi:putative membrane protein
VPKPVVGLEERTVGLTSYMHAVPSAMRSAMALIVLGFIFGLLLAMVGGRVGAAGLIEAGGQGIFLVSIPAFLSAVTTVAIKRDVTLRRILFLALVCALLYASFYILAVASGELYAGSNNLIFVGYGLSFILWYAIAKIVFRLRYTALLFAILQLAYNSLFFFASRLIVLESGPLDAIVKFYFVSGIFLLALYAIFWLINAPLKRNFGISGIDALSMFIAQWIMKSSDLEEMFDSVGQEIETTVGVVAFKGAKEKCAFIVPNVHYGPIGNLGGSGFPRLVASMAEARHHMKAFVFHGTATHDFNPVSTAEVEKVWAACDTALRRIKYEKAAGDFAIGASGTAKAHCLRFGNSAFVGLTRAPRTTEDIDFALGMAIGERARALGVQTPIICDAHNAEKGEITRIDSGDPIGFEYMDSMEAAVKKADGSGLVRLGTAADSFEGFEPAGIGVNGLRCAAFSFGKKTYLLLLFDANGILPAFRRELLGIVSEGTGFMPEAYTTDTHSINLVRGVLNPIGSTREDEIKKRVLECAKRAIAEMEEVKVGSAVERFRIKVIGPRQSSEFIGTVNSIVAIAKIAVPAMLIATVLLVLWAVTKI